VLIVTPPVLHALFPARALALPACRRAVHPLRGPLAPPIDVTAGAMPSTSHPSAPYDVDQDRQPDRPKDDEADHHKGDPSWPAEVIYTCHDIRHGGFTSRVLAHVNVYNIHMANGSRFVKGAAQGNYPLADLEAARPGGATGAGGWGSWVGAFPRGPGKATSGPPLKPPRPRAALRTNPAPDPPVLLACRASAAARPPDTGHQTRAIRHGPSDVLATVNVQFSTVHVARLLRTQEIDGLGHFLWLTQAPQRDLLVHQPLGPR
jgi:hypothetical protein